METLLPAKKIKLDFEENIKMFIDQGEIQKFENKIEAKENVNQFNAFTLMMFHRHFDDLTIDEIYHEIYQMEKSIKLTEISLQIQREEELKKRNISRMTEILQTRNEERKFNLQQIMDNNNKLIHNLKISLIESIRLKDKLKTMRFYLFCLFERKSLEVEYFYQKLGWNYLNEFNKIIRQRLSDSQVIINLDKINAVRLQLEFGEHYEDILEQQTNELDIEDSYSTCSEHYEEILELSNELDIEDSYSTYTEN